MSGGGQVTTRGPVYSGGSRVVVARPYYNRYYRPYYISRPYFYDPFFWGSYGWGWGWGAGLGYGYGWGWGYPGYYGGYGYPYGYGYGYGYRNYSEARIEVKPKDAKVYVDGYYAGVVDDFDGWAQRLEAPPGEHEITIYMEGFHSLSQKLFFQPTKTVHIKGELQRLPNGAPNEPVPQPIAPPPGQQQQYRQPAPGYGTGYGTPYGTAQGNPDDPQAQEPPPSQPQQPYGYGGRPARRGPQVTARATDPSQFGTLSIRVQPADATILVDGERWNMPEGQTGFSIQMAPGRHRVEVRKEGYRGYSADVEIQPGNLTPLNVSLLSARGEVE